MRYDAKIPDFPRVHIPYLKEYYTKKILGKQSPLRGIHRWTQEEIAAQIGTVREVVARTLRAFADAGLLRMEQHRIFLLDRAGLEAEARK
jgi:CRP/FNR family transcriptional regulator